MGRIKKLVIIGLLLLGFIAVSVARPSVSFALDYTKDPSCQGAWLFEEGQGTVAADASGNANTGTFLADGEPAWSTDTPGPFSTYSTNYDDGNDKVTISEVIVDENSSIVMWLKPDTVFLKTFLGKYDGDNYVAIRTSTSIRIQDDNSHNLNWTVPTLSAGTWCHIAITKDSSSNWRLFVNGIESTTGAINDPDLLYINMIGQGYTNNNYDYIGKIDEVAIFNRVLSVDEINDIMNNGLGATGAPPVNNPPTLDPIGNKTIEEGNTLSFEVSATDPESTPLTYSVTNLPIGTGTTFNSATHIFSWTPTYEQAGTYSGVRFEVSDGEFTDYEEITITVTNVNQPPVLDPIGDKSVQEDNILSFAVTASDPDTGDIVTISASSLESWMSFDGSMFSAHPTSGDNGVYAVTFTASDGELTDYEEITITVEESSSGTPDASCIGAWLFEEGSGTSVDDSSGNSNTGTFLADGEPAWSLDTPGPFSTYSTNYDDGNDKVAISEVIVDENSSIVLWLKPGNVSAKLFLGKDDRDNYVAIINSTSIRIQDDNSHNLNWTVPTLSTDTWYHITITKDSSSNWRLFVNGIESSTGAINAPDPLYIDMIGQGYSNDNYDYTGKIDEVAIFNRVLSVEEINDIMNNGLLVDSTANSSPTIDSFNPPEYSSFTEEDAVEITITASDPDNDNLEYQISIDGQIKQGWSVASTYQWQTQAGDHGYHTIKGEVRDTDGAIDTKEVQIYVFRKPIYPAQ